jgi:hypothetical protein
VGPGYGSPLVNHWRVMQTRYKSVLIGIGLLATAYTGHHAFIWGEAMLAVGENKIVCMALERQLLIANRDYLTTSNNPQTKDDLTRILNATCWKDSGEKIAQEMRPKRKNKVKV